MADSVEEFQINIGAITANQANGFHLDSYPYLNAFPAHAYVKYVVVDNQSEANVVFIPDTSRPKTLAGERKHIECPRDCREVFFEADATVTTGQLLVTVGIVRGWP